MDLDRSRSTPYRGATSTLSRALSSLRICLIIDSHDPLQLNQPIWGEISLASETPRRELGVGDGRRTGASGIGVGGVAGGDDEGCRRQKRRTTRGIRKGEEPRESERARERYCTFVILLPSSLCLFLEGSPPFPVCIRHRQAAASRQRGKAAAYKTHTINLYGALT